MGISVIISIYFRVALTPGHDQKSPKVDAGSEICHATTEIEVILTWERSASDTPARNLAKTCGCVEKVDGNGGDSGHTCKKSGEKSCDGVVLGCNRPTSGTHMQEIWRKLVGVW